MPRRLAEPIPIVSKGPLKASSFVWRRGDGGRALTVVCKVTYELRPEISPPARAQDDINAEDIHWGGDERHSLRAPSDLVPFKQRADVLVTGHVYAPPGQSVRSLSVRLVVGAMEKSLAVYGDRSFLPSGQLSEPAELKKVPLCWERAAGGPGTSNPVGVSFNSMGHGGGWRWAPNVQPPEIVAASARDPLPPAGMGPLAPAWPDRSRKLGSFAASWDHRRWPDHPLPSDIDAAYFNSAPRNQQVDQIAPNELLILENLHPQYPRLATRLEGIVPKAVLRRHARPGEPEKPLNLRCDTLWIDTDRSVCCVTWRGSIALETAEGGEIHVTGEGLRRAPSAAESPRGSREASFASEPRAGEPMSAGGGPESAVETVTIDLGLLAAVLGPAVPFVPAAPGAAPITVASVEVRERRPPELDATATLTAPLVVDEKALPAGWIAPSFIAPPEPIAAPTPPAPPEVISAPPPEPMDSPSPRLPPEPFGLPRPALVGLIAPAAEPEPSPPPLIGPIARTAEPPEPAEPSAPAIDPEAFSIEKWAAISAEIDKASRPRAEVIRSHELTEIDVDAVERHWKAALGREAASGGYSLRFKHDAAYVGALERLRDRPISAPEYARILAASERRQVPAALREMELPEAAHMPIVRVWTGKLARDPKLSFEMIRAVADLREGPGSSAQEAS